MHKSGGVARAAGSTLLKSKEQKRDARDEALEALEQEVESLRQAVQQEHGEIAGLSASLGELFMRNSCEEYLLQLERRIQVIENRNFSAGGLGGFRFHFYPRGDVFCEEGYCSLYLHLPPDTKVSRTLFVGRARHGPSEADSLKPLGTER
eukprot:g17297.t1